MDLTLWLFAVQLSDEWVIGVDFVICNSVSLTALQALTNVMLSISGSICATILNSSLTVIPFSKQHNKSTSSAGQLIADSCWLTSTIWGMKSSTESWDFIRMFTNLDLRWYLAMVEFRSKRSVSCCQMSNAVVDSSETSCKTDSSASSKHTSRKLFTFSLFNVRLAAESDSDLTVWAAVEAVDVAWVTGLAVE